MVSWKTKEKEKICVIVNIYNNTFSLRFEQKGACRFLFQASKINSKEVLLKITTQPPNFACDKIEAGRNFESFSPKVTVRNRPGVLFLTKDEVFSFSAKKAKSKP